MCKGRKSENHKQAPAWDLAEARRIVLSRLCGYCAEVYLFGSHARGQAERISDIDIGVLPQAPLPPGLMSDIREALEESEIIYKVDLVDLSEVTPSFLREVLRTGVRWSVSATELQ